MGFGSQPRSRYEYGMSYKYGVVKGDGFFKNAFVKL